MEGVFMACAAIIAGALAVQGLWHLIASLFDRRNGIVIDRGDLFGEGGGQSTDVPAEGSVHHGRAG